MDTVADMGSGKVLLVEGDPAALGLLSRGLTRFGLSVEGVSDADRAIDAVIASRPDVVVTEVSEGSDLRLLERLRLLPQTQDVPVLLLTKGAWARRKSQLRDLGVQELLAKPAFVQDVAVLSWLHAGSAAREDQFRGELGDASCAVLLRGLLAGGRSGELLLSPLGGKILFREGAVVDASLPPLHGERALLRLMALDAKSYELSFHPVEGAAKMTVELPELTGRGFEHVRRFTALRKEIPALDAVVSQDFRALSGALDALSSPLRAVLRLFDGRRTLSAVLDDSPFDDITSAQSVIQLHTLGLLAYPEAEAEAAPASSPDVAEMDPIRPPPLPERPEIPSLETPPQGSMDSMVGLPMEAEPASRVAEEGLESPLAAPPPSSAEMDLEDAFFKSAVVGDAASGRSLDNPAMRRAFWVLAIVALAVGGVVAYRSVSPGGSSEAEAARMAIEAPPPGNSGAPAAKVELVDAPAPAPDEAKVAPAPAEEAKVAPSEAPLDVAAPDTRSLLTEGIAAYHARDFKSALVKLEAAVKQAPEDSEAQLYLGLTLFELGKLPAAKAALSRALALDGSNAQAELFLGTIAQEQGHDAEARVHYSAYLRLSPNGDHASEVKSVLRTLKERE
jgi:CheY-like chemotaxis protein/Flp pilus assembly protein TadD